MAAGENVGLCVFCRKRPIHPAWRPFCGERCKVQDLARWADGTYAVPGETPVEPDESERSEKEKGKS